MIYPKKNPVIHWFLDRYVSWLVGKSFFDIQFNELNADKDRSVLLIANHFSIWDGLILYWLNKRLFHKKFHVMMLEETMKKEIFLKYGGAFSVNKNSREIITSLEFASQLLTDPQNLVLMFPQGKLHSNFIERVDFEKGIMRVMKQAEGTFQLISAVTFIEYFKYKKPTAFISLKHNAAIVNDLGAFNEAYQHHYDEAKLQQSKIVV